MNTAQNIMPETLKETYQTTGKPLLDDPKMRVRNKLFLM